MSDATDLNSVYSEALCEQALDPAEGPPENWEAVRADDPAVVDFSSALDAPPGPSPAVALWLRKLHAGTGTSIRRESFVRRWRGIDAGAPALPAGAKGTDLAVRDATTGRWVSLAELQARKALHRLERGDFASLLLEDLASPETSEPLARIWAETGGEDGDALPARARAAGARFRRLESTRQLPIPCLTPEGGIHASARAPGGHGFFAFELLHRAAFRPESLPAAPEGETLVAAIANGEDLAAFPERALLEWLHRERVPMALVATDRTAIDRKGGYFRRARRPGEAIARLELFERAQAEAEGPTALARFEAESPALFNTNLLLVNLAALGERFDAWRARLGEARFSAEVRRALRPALIRNAKGDRVQLEGALGSVVLGLDRAWRASHPDGPPLVRLARIPASRRTRCFSPVKSAFDFVLQFHSDRFRLEPETGELTDLAPSGALPPVARLPEAWGSDLESTLAALGGAGLRELADLTVTGADPDLAFAGVSLRGRVEIAASPGVGPLRLEARLAAAGLLPALADQRLEIGPDRVRISPLSGD